MKFIQFNFNELWKSFKIFISTILMPTIIFAKDKKDNKYMENDMSNDIERLKAFHQVESFLDDETRLLLIEKLSLENSNLENRLPGLRVEDEFVLMLYFLDESKHIVSLDETTSVLTHQSYQSDYIVHFKNDKKIMIEVKSTEKEKYKISKSNFDKRLLFAQDMGLELYFALKIKGHWSLFSSNYLIEHNYRINYEDDLKNSILCETLNSQMLLIPKGLKAESIYSKNTSNGLIVQHGEFGELISYKLFFNDKLIIEVSPEEKNYWHTIYIIELWHDFMSANLTSETINEFETLVIETSTENFINYDFQYFMSTINHTINSGENRYNSTSFLKYIATNKDIALTKEILLMTLDELVALGIPVIRLDNK